MDEIYTSRRFLCLKFGSIFVWRKKISDKADLKMLVKLTAVIFFLPLSISDFSAASLRELLGSFRRQVLLLFLLSVVVSSRNCI
jgi:hypothetical protein